jgi:SAM-dependent methyltransferase
MGLLANFATRNKQPEIIDQPGLDKQQHQHALRGLARINWVSGSAGILWPALRRLAREKQGQPLRVLDIATGAGDVPIRLFQRAKRIGLPLKFAGADISPTALAHARERARLGRAAIEFFSLDALHEPLPGDYDVITSSLFLHHLETAQATDMLRRMGQAARTMVLVNDLVRSRLGYWAAWVGTRVLSSSSIVHVDGPRSVAGAFTIPEALHMAEEAALAGAAVSWRWPFRFLLQWRRQA